MEKNIILDDLPNSNETIAIKARFKSPSSQTHGQLLLMLSSDKNFESYNIVVSTNSDLYNLEPHASWDIYEETIANQIWGGEYNKNLTGSLKDYLKKISTDAKTLQMLYKNAFEYDYENLQLTLSDILNWIIIDKNLILDVGIQQVPKSELQEKKAEKSAKEKTDGRGYDDVVMLPIEAIVAPVKGKPIFDLKIGDRIMVKIKPQSGKDQNYFDSLGLSENQVNKPTPAEVIDIRLSNKKNETIEIITQINKKVYGVLYEEEKQVKIRLYDPNLDGFMNLKNNTTKNTISEDFAIEPIGNDVFSKKMVLIFFLFVIIMILFISFILIYW